MYRNKIQELRAWKNKAGRKPLVLRGARQVGKTWLLQEFGRTEYAHCAYINLDNNPDMLSTFALDYDVERIVNNLEVVSGQKITKNDTLIILDEIQEIPRALASLKYFCENAPDYHVAVAGSLLGIALHEGASFPVGKVDMIDIYPMTFAEFLRAVGKDSYADLLESGNPEQIGAFHDTLNDLLKTYFITGGMPAVIKNYLDEGNLLTVRDVQSAILNAYDQDFSKHAPITIAPRIREIFDILPRELAKENRKFIFNMIRTGARAKDYDAALLWLEDTGITTRVTRANTAKIPLSVYADRNIFKLFMLDVGLLGAKARLPIQSILGGNDLFGEFKGALAEQFVFQELRAAKYDPYYYATDDSRAEIDFMVQTAQGEILPIEVKSGTNTSSASLNSFLRKNPAISRAVKLSLLPYKVNEHIDNFPLYLAPRIDSTTLS
ncbi:ATP-binding protein [Candidatus Saccharibacteria bacterium]|nr:ATP-binding protein [Candidatus Saccharibacteria bacterium]